MLRASFFLAGKKVRGMVERSFISLLGPGRIVHSVKSAVNETQTMAEVEGCDAGYAGSRRACRGVVGFQNISPGASE